MADTQQTCAAWARHFFAAADEAVQQYVSESLLSAIEEGEALQEQAEVLQDFAPPTCSLRDGLRELEAALALPDGPQWQSAFPWLQLLPAASSSSSSAAAAADSGPAQLVQPVPAAAAQRQPQAAVAAAAAAKSSSSLSIGASEFRPSFGAASLTASMDGLQLGSSSAGGGVGRDSWAGSQGSGAAARGQQGGWAAQDGDWGCAAGASAAFDEEAADADAAGEMVAGGPAAQEAFLAVLAEQFPLWSDDALRTLFSEQGSSLASTIHTLCALEAEVEAQAQAGSAAAAASGGKPEAAAPSFTLDDFPSLGGAASSSSSSSATGGSGSRGAAYAARAAAAAALPAQPARPGSQPRQAGPGPAPAPAPIWEAQGVQRFDTGAAVALEYAELRADARDLARVRNACFQQATAAYLAGNKRLARELGAKGRAAGEQMHAAHAAAAAEMFQRRNPGAAAVAAGGGSSSRGGAVETVDLHGLHVSEALALLEALLLRLQQGGSRRRVRVVVGEGQHGRVPARLPTAVKRWLQDQGVAFSEPYSGLLEVRL